MGAQGRWPFHTAWLGRRGEKGEVFVGRGPHSEGCGGCAEGSPEAGPVCAECEGSREARWQRTRGSWKDCPLCGAADFRKDGYADGSSRNQLLPSAAAGPSCELRLRPRLEIRAWGLRCGSDPRGVQGPPAEVCLLGFGCRSGPGRAEGAAAGAARREASSRQGNMFQKHSCQGRSLSSSPPWSSGTIF